VHQTIPMGAGRLACSIYTFELNRDGGRNRPRCMLYKTEVKSGFRDAASVSKPKNKNKNGVQLSSYNVRA
jgi:hypothetical protein